jgi:hypothetical protein
VVTTTRAIVGAPACSSSTSVQVRSRLPHSRWARSANSRRPPGTRSPRARTIGSTRWPPRRIRCGRASIAPRRISSTARLAIGPACSRASRGSASGAATCSWPCRGCRSRAASSTVCEAVLQGALPFLRAGPAAEHLRPYQGRQPLRQLRCGAVVRARRAALRRLRVATRSWCANGWCRPSVEHRRCLRGWHRPRASPSMPKGCCAPVAKTSTRRGWTRARSRGPVTPRAGPAGRDPGGCGTRCSRCSSNTAKGAGRAARSLR